MGTHHDKSRNLSHNYVLLLSRELFVPLLPMVELCKISIRRSKRSVVVCEAALGKFHVTLLSPAFDLHDEYLHPNEVLLVEWHHAEADGSPQPGIGTDAERRDSTIATTSA